VPLVFLHALPAWVPPVVLAAALVAGLALRGIGGAIALLVVAAVLGWLALVSWPRLSPAGRLLRVAVVALVIAVAVIQGLR
jgi:hypothetical protein